MSVRGYYKVYKEAQFVTCVPYLYCNYLQWPTTVFDTRLCNYSHNFLTNKHAVILFSIHSVLCIIILLHDNDDNIYCCTTVMIIHKYI